MAGTVFFGVAVFFAEDVTGGVLTVSVVFGAALLVVLRAAVAFLVDFVVFLDADVRVAMESSWTLLHLRKP
ncbi:hypothetical protein [uncultured Celeribacter sp.]|uniref:hypothetical protein n=1 Tax=uncultured Celeribacter sp. TaxID=1303376 RepID=UPI002AA5ED48|nr:hypothetical protein [uncultured Celeribacter sp.]